MNAMLTRPRGRVIDTRDIDYVNSAMTAYVIRASLVNEAIYNPSRTMDLAVRDAEILARHADNGLQVLSGPRSVKEAVEEMFDMKDFVFVARGIAVHLAYVVGESTTSEGEPLVVLKINGIRERLKMSEGGKRRLRAALRLRDKLDGA